MCCRLALIPGITDTPPSSSLTRVFWEENPRPYTCSLPLRAMAPAPHLFTVLHSHVYFLLFMFWPGICDTDQASLELRKTHLFLSRSVGNKDIPYLGQLSCVLVIVKDPLTAIKPFLSPFLSNPLSFPSSILGMEPRVLYRLDKFCTRSYIFSPKLLLCSWFISEGPCEQKFPSHHQCLLDG